MTSIESERKRPDSARDGHSDDSGKGKRKQIGTLPFSADANVKVDLSVGLNYGNFMSLFTGFVNLNQEDYEKEGRKTVKVINKKRMTPVSDFEFYEKEEWVAGVWKNDLIVVDIDDKEDSKIMVEIALRAMKD